MKKGWIKFLGVIFSGMLAFGCACPVENPEKAVAQQPSQQPPACPECVKKVEDELNALKLQVESLKSQLDNLKVEAAEAKQASQKAIEAANKAEEATQKAEAAAKKCERVFEKGLKK
ncbi:hypothetical protein F1847_06945 [Thermodesulfobacterium sp. TA1]|uniref:alanine-zipper protein n=1 Tax=Thermodesulfobacterium sp. TA1 TaxID=2234087 RepID=UPI0012325260|nr:alanine-zipper protein [Thermodesulfobacterium sp. TA1]QER42494.1 hypothetical protein F1847_06945 [Thermodesulfobacterium sp. TA1]